MNALAQAGYAFPHGAELFSNQYALRPDSAVQNAALIYLAPSLGHGHIAVSGMGNLAGGTLDLPLLSGNPAMLVMGDQSRYQFENAISYSQPDFAWGNISWTAQAWNPDHTPAESLWTSLRLQTLLAQFRRSGSTSHAERIASRIEYLYRESLEDDELPLSLASADEFVSFLRIVQPITYPDITLTSSGHIFVTWGRVTGQKLSLEFGDGRIKYTFLYKDQIGNSPPAKGYGDLPIDVTLMFIAQLPRALKKSIFANAQ